jgi:diguanylate cyclase (GGDEF)-like protein
MLNGDGPFVSLAKWLALVVAVLVSTVPPAAYFHFSIERKIGEITGEINVEARLVAQLISSNPDYWVFEGQRISELIAFDRAEADAQLRRVYDSRDNIVAQRPAHTPDFVWLTLKRDKQLFDYGMPVGRVEITQSLKSLCQTTLIVGTIALLAGLLVYWGLRVVPLRLLRRAWDRISYLASHDALTGLPNRMTFLDRLENALDRARRSPNPVTVYSIDLDHFKDINDTLGHAAGDLLLIQVAARMRSVLRRGDTVARLGGDEFAMIQTGIDQPQTAAALAERIIAELSQPFDLNGQEAVVGTSVGMALHGPGDTTSPQQLLTNADLALYAAKHSGRSTYRFFQEKMNAELLARKALEVDLRKALREEQLELHYQPQVNLADQRIIGLEALLRWRHAERGDVPPAEVIPVAESTGLIGPLTEWVLNNACREAVRWAPLGIAVNLSPALFRQQGLVALVENALAASGLPAARLELEITEEIMLADTETTLDKLRRLKALGVRIAMDDFGTGYSSLGYLRQFPFDKLKIDQTFIETVNQNGDAKAIVRAIINMGKALNMHVNAEGVETSAQADVLKSEGCEEVQGFLYGRPMHKRDIEALLRSTGTLGPARAEDRSLPLIA